MSDIKITLPCAFTFSNIVVKIISLSISIVDELNIDDDYGHDYYVIDMTDVKDEKEWYFVTRFLKFSYFWVGLGKVLSNIMFVRNSGSGNNGENALWKVFYYIKK